MAGCRATRRATCSNPEMLYRPWRLEEQGHKLQMIFRDHALSDQIGFHYQRYEPEQAADDLIGKLEAIGRAIDASGSQTPPLVSIILDGENCWEYYPDGGVEFLRALYQRLADHPHDQAGPRARLSERSSGHRSAGPPCSPAVGSATISPSGLATPACNRAWDLLTETRAALAERAARNEVPRRRSEAGLGRAVHRRRERLVLVVRRSPFQRPGLAVRPIVSQALAKRLHAHRAGAAGRAAQADQRAPAA